MFTNNFMTDWHQNWSKLQESWWQAAAEGDNSTNSDIPADWWTNSIKQFLQQLGVQENDPFASLADSLPKFTQLNQAFTQLFIELLQSEELYTNDKDAWTENFNQRYNLIKEKLAEFNEATQWQSDLSGEDAKLYNYQVALAEFMTIVASISLRSNELFFQRCCNMIETEQKPNNLQDCYTQWLQCNGAAFAETIISPRYQQALAQLTNAWMTLKMS